MKTLCSATERQQTFKNYVFSAPIGHPEPLGFTTLGVRACQCMQTNLFFFPAQFLLVHHAIKYEILQYFETFKRKVVYIEYRV